MNDKTITITDRDIALLRSMRFDWDDEIEFGGVASDFKRPFGNSDVLGDIETILSLPPGSVNYGPAQQCVMRLAAIVNHLAQNADAAELIGVECVVPWRAERAMA